MAAAVVDATGGHMAPRDAGGFAGGADAAGEHRIALEAFRLVDFTGIDIRFAGVSRGVDEKTGTRLTDYPDQPIRMVAVGTGAGNRLIRDAAFLKQVLKCLADIAGGAEEKDHVGGKAES